MANHIGAVIHEARTRRSMSFGDLARRCSAVTARQISRIASRLVLFEREGVRDRKLLQKVIAALDLDPSMVNELLRRQRDEELAAWSAWADEPVPMELHVRPFAGFSYRHPLPVEIAADELLAIEYARQKTEGRDELRTVLAVNRRRSIVFARGEVVGTIEATPEHSSIPFVQIGRRRIVFETTSADDQS
jgi:hypothetical protein